MDFRRSLGQDLGLGRRRSVWQRVHLDPILLLLLLLTACFGLVVLYSASGQNWHLVSRQAAYFVIGFGVMVTVAQIDPQVWRRWSLWLYAVGLLLLVAVALWGIGAKGAQRWLDLGGFRFQPSEIMKVVLPIMVAAYLSNRLLPPRLKHVAASLLLVVVPALLIAQQPDLGTALLIATSGLVVLFLAGLRWRYIFSALVLLLAAAPLVWHFALHDYQRRRIITLFNPEADKLGAGWNIIQSMTAIGSGGVGGKGWLHGTQSQLDFLPESHTDFIIAVLAEEFGLLGVLALLAGYLLIIGRGLQISVSAADTFSRLLAGSITLTFFVYVFVNVGMVAGLLPVVGVPLPLISYGGTAIVTLMMGFGMLMSISTAPKPLQQ